MTELVPYESVNIHKPTAYSFRFEKPLGCWAIFTLNEATGEFILTSDWGTFSYRWNVNSLGGKKLTQFLAECEPDYIVRKFAQDNKNLSNIIDVAATKAEIKRLIEENPNYYDLEEVDNQLDYSDIPSNPNRHSDTLKYFYDLFGDSEFIRYSSSYEDLFLREQLLPFFLNWLKTNILHGT